jgi:hypothetical protein
MSPVHVNNPRLRYRCMSLDPEKTRGTVNDEYSFSKYKLPKSLSYPLKRSLLDSALRSASVYETVWLVQYYGKPYGHLVLRALFSPEQDGAFAAGRVSIGVWPVAAQQRKATELVLVEKGLHVLCDWLAKTAAEGNAWRGLQHSLELSIDAEMLRCAEQ